MSAVVAVAVASSCCCIKIWLWVRLLFEAFTVSFQWCNNDLNWVMNLNVKVKKTALNAVKRNDNILRTEMLKLLVSPRPLIRAITCVVPEPIFPCAKRRTRVLPITPLIRRLRMFPLDVFLASILGSFLPRWVCALSSHSSKICISTNNKWAYTRKYIPNDDRIWNTLQKLRWSVLAAAQMEFKHARERGKTRKANATICQRQSATTQTAIFNHWCLIEPIKINLSFQFVWFIFNWFSGCACSFWLKQSFWTIASKITYTGIHTAFVNCQLICCCWNNES